MKLMRMGKSFEKTKIEKNKNEEGRKIERERWKQTKKPESEGWKGERKKKEAREERKKVEGKEGRLEEEKKQGRRKEIWGECTDHGCITHWCPRCLHPVTVPDMIVINNNT